MALARRSIATALAALAASGCGRQDPADLWQDARAAFEARDFPRAGDLMERVGKLRSPAPEDHFLRAQLHIAADRADEALAELNAVPAGHKIDGFDLRLASPGSGDGAPAEGKNLVVVSREGDALHFRIFDGAGKVVVDEGEAALASRARRVADVKTMLAPLWPPHAPTREEKDRVIAEMAPLFDYSLLAAQAHFEAGHLELQRNRARVAEAHYRRAIQLQPRTDAPERAKALRELIYILGFELRRPELNEAFRALDACESLSFQQTFLWCLTRGVAWEPGETATKLKAFVDADPDDTQARLALAELLRRINNHAEAEAALAPLPDDIPEARAIRAQLALDRGDEAKAEALLAGGPRVHLDLAVLRGRLAIARGDDKGAVASFRDAVAAEPNNRDAVFGLAHALQRAGDPEAQRLLDLSAKYERLGTLVQRAAAPGAAEDVALIRDLGAACAAVGRLPEARAWYRIAVKKNPFDSEAQQALYRLNNEEKPPAS